MLFRVKDQHGQFDLTLSIFITTSAFFSGIRGNCFEINGVIFLTCWYLYSHLPPQSYCKRDQGLVYLLQSRN